MTASAAHQSCIEYRPPSRWDTVASVFWLLVLVVCVGVWFASLVAAWREGGDAWRVEWESTLETAKTVGRWTGTIVLAIAGFILAMIPVCKFLDWLDRRSGASSSAGPDSEK